MRVLKFKVHTPSHYYRFYAGRNMTKIKHDILKLAQNDDVSYFYLDELPRKVIPQDFWSV